MPVATRIDPLEHYREGVVGGADRRPIPLTSTTIDVALASAFATVRTKRIFRNAESASIEATMTFPVPVDAVAHGLRVVVDGRTLVGMAAAKVAARASYEAAMDAGKTAILHEEALKGVHVLAIGHIPPGQEVSVEITWSKPLTFAGPTPSLRIPTTVAEIYGRLPLLPADDLVVHDTLVFEATLTVRVDAGMPHLRGAALRNGEPATVKLDRPIDLAFTGLVLRDLEGTAADGRAVRLNVADDGSGDGALRLGILFDRSGSTADPIDGCFDCESTKAADTKPSDIWSAAMAGLRDALSMGVRIDDAFEVWQFDSSVDHLGSARGAAVRDLLRHIGKPRGGTEAGRALAAAAACEAIGDIVFITDGRTGAIPVQAFAASGKRISAVLCGANSLDAMIGHLCALTGGQIIVAASDNIGPAIATVVAAARRPVVALPSASLTALPPELAMLRGGAMIRARWPHEPGGTAIPDAVGAYAAALALPMLTQEAATRIAVAHGLCSHLTSLVVVDEAGAAQDGVPNQRKVPLSRPIEAGAFMEASMTRAPRTRVAAATAAPAPAMAAPTAPSTEAPASAAPSVSAPRPTAPSVAAPSKAVSGASRNASLRRWFSAQLFSRTNADGGRVDLGSVAASIDWDKDANALSKGDLSGLSSNDRGLVEKAAAIAEIATLASRAGTTSERLVIGLLAEAARHRSSGAKRVARQILAGFAKAERVKAAGLLGL